MHDHFHAVPELTDFGHSCPKPIAWGKWFISRLTKIGGSVLDPFMGSGTTGVAAVKLERKFIGIEIEPKYFDIACQRISEALRQPDLFIERPPPAKQLSLDDYDRDKDFAGSLNEGYRAIRERMAAGGPGWTPK